MILKPRLELLIATYNAGKIREIEHTLRHLPIQVRYLREFPGISTIEETGDTYEENAILKARGYSQQTGLFALGDDSGLEVDALDGRPGVHSARFGGDGASDQDRRQKLLRELLPHRRCELTARFVCLLVVAGWPATPSNQNKNAPQVLNVSAGTVEGSIAVDSRGTGGFGYDPLFIPHGYEETFGELSAEVKARLSHRAKALEATRAFLIQILTQLDPASTAT